MVAVKEVLFTFTKYREKPYIIQLLLILNFEVFKREKEIFNKSNKDCDVEEKKLADEAKIREEGIKEDRKSLENFTIGLQLMTPPPPPCVRKQQ